MMKKILLLGLVLVLLSSFVSGVNLTTDLVSYHQFDNNSVTQVDRVGSFDGTVSDATFTNGGKINGAYDFDGADDWISFPAGFITSVSQDYSVSMWFKLDTLAGTQILWTPYDDVYGYLHVASSNLKMYMDVGGAVFWTKAITLSTGTWYHAVFTYSNSAGGNLYLNAGIPDADPATGNMLAAPGNNRIGTDSNGNSDTNGVIDEFGFWNRVLTSDEVSDLYNNGTGLSYPFSTPTPPLSDNFSVSAFAYYNNVSISNFSVDINGTIYTTTNGSVTTSILQNSSSLFNVTVFDGFWYNRTYENLNVSSDLDAFLNQTDITVNFKFSSGDFADFGPINFTDLDNGFFFNVSGGQFNFSPVGVSNNFYVSCDNEIFAPFNYTFPFAPLQNTTYDIVVNETQNVLTFLDANSSSPINGSSIIVNFPSGFSLNLTTNVSGQVSFSYIQNNSLEFGDYVFEFSKVGYVALNISEEINSSVVPFFATYNISRARLLINIFDRVTRNLLSGVNVSVAFIGLFNETTLTGTVVKDNLTIVGGDYLVYASSEGYKTSVRSLTFTNQEEFTLNFYLLNLSEPTYGTLFVTTFDSFYRTISGAKVELLEYIPSSLSYVSVAECVSNIDAQCSFAVELNTKVYYIRATAIVNGVLLVAETSQNGEIFTFSGDNRDLTFYTSTSFQVEPSTSLIYEISESFISNVSSISNSFYSLDGTAYTMCIEYFKEDVSVTGDTYCLSSTSALQNIDANILLNRSNNYRADVYIKTSNGNILLDKYVYPSDSGITGVMGDSLVGAIIIVLWIFALGFCIYSSNMVLWFTIALVLAWLQVILFPLNSIVSFAVFKSLISVLCLLVARKKRDVV